MWNVQVKRLELLLDKCKEMIRVNKAKMQQLTGDLETTQKQLKSKTKEFESLQVVVCCRISRCTKLLYPAVPMLLRQN